MDIETKVKNFLDEIQSMGYGSLLLAINKKKNKVIESVQINSEDMGFAIFKLIVDSKDEGFADIALKSAMAAKAKLKHDKDVDGEVSDMFSKLKLN